MNGNYVTLSLETYDELREKANKFDELKEKLERCRNVNLDDEKLGNDIEKTLKDLIDGLNQFVEDMNKNYEENQEVESCQEKK